MKLTINRLALLKVLNTVSVAIEQKSPTPAFLNFKLNIQINTKPISEPIFIPIIVPRYTPNIPIFNVIPNK